MNKDVEIQITGVGVRTPFELCHLLAMEATIPRPEISWHDIPYQRTLRLNISEANVPGIPDPRNTNRWERYLYREHRTRCIHVFLSGLRQEKVKSAFPNDYPDFSVGWAFTGTVLIDSGCPAEWLCEGELALPTKLRNFYGKLTLINWLK